jgi:hypothetical protein
MVKGEQLLPGVRDAPGGDSGRFFTVAEKKKILGFELV